MRLKAKIKLKYYGGNSLQFIFHILCLPLFIVTSCTQSKDESNKTLATKSNPFLPPVSIIVKGPINEIPRNNLEPVNLSFPKSGTAEKTILTRNGSKTLNLSAPETRSADFFVTMQNYNTEQGLVYSAILCGYLDKTGNLWFGTMGGGVSRFDGKYFTNFTSDQGLAGNRIDCITEDKKGNIWFATNVDGVSRYDGKSFTTISSENGLPNNLIKSIIEDKAGNIWFASYGAGVSRYTPSEKGINGEGAFKNFTTVQGLANNNVNTVFQDKIGNIWFGTDDGVSRYTPSSSGKGEDGVFSNFTTVNGLVNNKVKCITEDKNGNIWFGTNDGVSRYSLRQKEMNGDFTFSSFTTAQGLPNNTICCVTEDKTGNLWFGTNGGGVSCYDGNVFSNLTMAQGLPNNFVMSITKDKMGYLWFGTLGGGISRYEGRSFSNVSTLQGIVNVWSITEDGSGNLWFGTNENGISSFTPYTSRNNGYGFFTKFTTTQGLPKNNVLCIKKDKSGNLWIGTDGAGASYFDGGLKSISEKGPAGSFTNFSKDQGLANNAVKCITEDKNGNVWFGTNGGGISRYNGGLQATSDGRYTGSFTNYTTEEGLANNFVRNSMEDKNGNLWFGTYGGGVSRFTPSSKKDSRFVGVFTNYSTPQGLANKKVRCITEDKVGNLWFGTDGGISLMSAAKINDSVNGRENNLFENFTVDDGISNNVVTQAIEDKEGNMIFGTNEGFTILRSGTHSFEIYNIKTGYPIKDINAGQGGMFLDSKGVIWAAMGDKVVRFDYNGINKSQLPSNVFIHSLKVDDENIVWNLLHPPENNDNHTKIKEASNLEESFYFGRELSFKELDKMRNKFSDIRFDSLTRFYPLPENLILPFKHNNITFDFGAVEPDRPSLVRYQYKLEGYDKDWRPVTDKTSATFGNIFEGNYTFKLKACSPYGVWGTPISYNFKVLSPWWRTWWMYLSYLIFGALSIGALIYWRERNLRREKDLLEEKVALRTDQLMQQKDLVEVQNKEITGNMLELEKLSIVASKTNNGVMICDKDGAMEYINEGMEQMLGYTLEEIKVQFGKFVQDFSHNPEIDKSIQQAIAGRIPITYEVLNKTKSGKNKWIASTLTPIENSKGELHKIVIIDVDVTENKRKSIEIQQSIDYARKIQNAILPDIEKISQSFPNSFVLYKPKDIVSGDFYWFEIWNESLVIAAVDCTGHGVPGALMSVIGSNTLHQIAAISPFNKPGWVLENLHEQVRSVLQQETEDSELKDGMDIVMCKIDMESKELEYAGANRPLYRISKGVLTIIKANNYSIGGYQAGGRRKFTSHKIKLIEGDTFYLFTDGYADQFGGQKKKKFMNKRLGKLLLDIQDKSMEEQKIILNDNFETWKGSEEQVDDILVIGIRI